MVPHTYNQITFFPLTRLLLFIITMLTRIIKKKFLKVIKGIVNNIKKLLLVYDIIILYKARRNPATKKKRAINVKRATVKHKNSK